MDYSEYKKEDVLVDESGTSIEPGIHEIKCMTEELFEGEDKNGVVRKVVLDFIFPKGQARVKEWYTINSGNPKAENIGIAKLNGLMVAAGLNKFSETWSTDGLVGKSVICKIIEVEKEGKKYLQIDDDYGRNYKPVKEETPAKVVKEEKPSASENTDEIPF